MKVIKNIRYEHVAFVFEAGGQRLGLDFGAFTSAETLNGLPKLDAVLVSHRHGDHFSEANLRTLGAPVSAPSDVVALLNDGVEAHTLRLGESNLVARFKVTPTQADHGPRVTNPVENYGFVIERDGCRIYFVGDMAVATPPPDGPFDVVLIPVGGGGFVFDPGQAFGFIKAIGYRGPVVPIHDAGPAEPDCFERFTRLAEGWCEVVVLGVGQSLEVGQ